MPFNQNSLLRPFGVNYRVRNPSPTPIDSTSPASSFVKGQLWQLDTRFVKIGHVGRLLVHHRIVVPTLKRSVSRESLSSIKDLRQFLTAHKAVLVEDFGIPV